MGMSNGRLKNPLALAVLVLLAENDLHPYAIAATLKERGLDKSIRSDLSSLYTVVRQLLRSGFITAAKVERSGRRPERTVYQLTPAGRDKMRARLRDVLATPVKEYPEFGAGLSLMEVLPAEELVPLLEKRSQMLALKEASERKFHDAWASQFDAHVRRTVVREYEMALLEAERRFVDELVRRIMGKRRGLARPR
jgi:DNA-binding PadR family transcriptional regulator